MSARKFGSNFVISVLLTGVAICALPARAQAQTAQQTEEVVVTGSRIPEPNLTSVSPVSVVGKDEAKFQGTTSVETLLQNLPAVAGAYNSGVGSNGATGTATVSLRNLGSYRTLVLVDGNRLMPGDPVIPAPDLKDIPTALIKRVEVVTGGASAVYGSDAVAGVVNFIMDRDFDGVRVDAQYGFAAHDNDNQGVQNLLNSAGIPVPKSGLDGFTYTATAIVGTEINGKGNITAYASYSKQTPILSGQRDYGTCLVGTFQSTGSPFDTHRCQGNANGVFGRFLNFNTSDNPNGTKTFVTTQASMGYNTNPPVAYVQGDERYNAGYFAHYTLTPKVELYSDLMFTDDSQVSPAAASGLFFNNGTHAINCANPLMSAAQAAVVCGPTAPKIVNGVSYNLNIGYRIPAATRVKYLNHDSFELGVGARGDLGDSWKYDVRVQQGRTTYNQLFQGDVSNTRINNALNVVNGPSGPVCADPNAVAAGCAPLDIFQANSAGITPAALFYIRVPAFKTGYTNEQVVSGNLTGNLGSIGGKSPWATEPIGIAAGVEYRREMLLLNADSEFAQGDLAGGGGVQGSAKGGYNVWDVYGEARIPIIQEAPLAKDLSLELGYRHSIYSLAGPVDAYKFSADWAITGDIMLRGGFNRAVRAPNLIELFSPRVVTLAAFNDPCAGAAGLTTAGCASTFSSAALAAQFLGKVPACAQSQCNVLVGSPADPTALKPEQANTITLGAVITPTLVPGLNVSLDYFNVAISNPIVQGIGPALIVSQCVNNNIYCNLIHRDPTTGSLFGGSLSNGYVENSNVNSGSLRTSGFDVAANYQIDLADVIADGLGGVALNFSGTATNNFTKVPVVGASAYDCVGRYGLVCGEPMPLWRHQMRVTWNSPWDFAFSVNWRHLGHVGLDLNTNIPSLATRGVGFSDTVDGVLPATDYFDVAMTWTVWDKMQFRVGVNNVFDKNPPVVDGGGNLGLAGFSSFGSGNTFPGVYDVIGRNIFMGLTADF